MGKGIRVAVVDDVEAVRLVFGDLIASIPGVLQVDRLSSLAELEKQIATHRPDLIFLDEVLPGEDPRAWVKKGQLNGILTYFVTGFSNQPLPVGIAGRMGKPSLDSWDLDRKRFEKVIAPLKG